MRWILTAATMLVLAASSLGQSAVIVAQVALTNQTSYIPLTALVTPESNALYRVSAYFEVLSLEHSGVCDHYDLNIRWSDTSPVVKGMSTLTVYDNSFCNAPYSAQKTVIVSDLAGKPLGYSVTGVGDAPLVPLNVYITVEQLQ